MMRESKIERADRLRHKAAGRLMLKFVSPGRVGVPDNIVLAPVPEEHRSLVAKYFRFAEYKQLNKQPRPTQERRINELREMGFQVDVIDRPDQDLQPN